jgi:hypothetical protein
VAGQLPILFSLFQICCGVIAEMIGPFAPLCQKFIFFINSSWGDNVCGLKKNCGKSYPYRPEKHRKYGISLKGKCPVDHQVNEKPP